MNGKAAVREFRKQALQLQALQYRMSLRADMLALVEPFTPGLSEAGEGGKWLEIASPVLSALLPARWNRMLNVGLAAWRVGRRFLSRR